MGEVELGKNCKEIIGSMKQITTLIFVFLVVMGTMNAQNAKDRAHIIMSDECRTVERAV